MQCCCSTTVLKKKHIPKRTPHWLASQKASQLSSIAKMYSLFLTECSNTSNGVLDQTWKITPLRAKPRHRLILSMPAPLPHLITQAWVHPKLANNHPPLTLVIQRSPSLDTCVTKDEPIILATAILGHQLLAHVSSRYSVLSALHQQSQLREDQRRWMEALRWRCCRSAGCPAASSHLPWWQNWWQLPSFRIDHFVQYGGGSSRAGWVSRS